MAYQYTLPEHYKIVDATAGPVTTNGGVTGDYVSLKHAHKAWLVLQFTQAAADATLISLTEATTVAGGGVKAVINDHKIWANEDTVATDTLVRQTDAKTFTLANDIKKKMVVFEIDPDALDVNNGFDVVGFTVADSTEATDFVSGVWVLAERYKQATPPSAIID